MAAKTEPDLQLSEMGGTRFVVFSPERGVLLEGDQWSFESPSLSSPVPTFTKEEANLKIRGLAEAGISNLRSKLVWPDLPNNQASRTACSNAAIPTTK